MTRKKEIKNRRHIPIDKSVRDQLKEAKGTKTYNKFIKELLTLHKTWS